MIVAVADTHALIWYLTASKQLSEIARIFVEQAAENGDFVGISTISLVEMVYLVEKRRIALESYELLVQALRDGTHVFTELPLSLSVAESLPMIPAQIVPDMPDRIIATTALHLGIPLITRDSQIRRSRVQTIW